MLKLGNTDINKIYLGSSEVNKAYLGDTLVYDNSAVPSFNFDDVNAIYTLRKPLFTTEWDKAVIRLRRSSDNDLKYVFFDNNGKISLSSLTSNISSIPSATTLGAWVGANDAYVALWLGLTPDNTIDTNKSVGQGNTSLQPQFILNGAILTKNGEPCIEFNGVDNYLRGITNATLNDGNNFTVTSLSSSNVSNSVNAVISTTLINNNNFVVMNDRRTNKLISRVVGTTTPGNCAYLTRQDINSQKLFNVVVKGNIDTCDAYYNNVFQDSKLWGGNYNNDTFDIGVNRNGVQYLNGTIQEVIIYPSDKTANLNEINTNINDYYNIY